MSALPPDVPRTVDPTKPNAARAYDYFLGGSHNFEADRAFAEEILKIGPHVPAVAMLNRSFLRRGVLHMLDQGIRQFLDLGSGIPTVGNTHQIAAQAGISANVVYVDIEPVAYHHAHQMLDTSDTATIVQADMRDVDAVLHHEDTQRLLDFTQPLGLLTVGVFLYLPDPEPADLLAAYRAHLVPDSYLAISTLTDEHANPELKAEVGRLQAAYARIGDPLTVRSHAEILRWFDGMELVEPGLVTLPEWHTDDLEELDSPARDLGYGALASMP